MKIIGAATGRKIRGYTPDELDFTLTVYPRENLISGTASGQTTVQDRILQTYTPSIIDNEADLASSNFNTPFFGGVVYTSVDPSIATVDESGRVTRVSDGMARINASIYQLTKQALVPVSRQGGATTEQFAGYDSDSLAYHLATTIDGLIAGKTSEQVTASLPLFSVRDHANGNYVRNPNCWLAGVASNLSCFSPWNTVGGDYGQHGGTLVSPRHIVLAEHFPLFTGNTIEFVSDDPDDHQPVTRTITAVQNVGPSNVSDDYATDIQVCLLDSDVPETIKFAKVLPSDWQSHLPSLSTTYCVPAVCSSQYKLAQIHDLIGIYAGDMVTFAAPTDAQRLKYYASLIRGDSGSPGFLLINGELVLVTTWSFGSGGYGPVYAAHLSAINAVMASLGGGYSLTEADLSSFPSYP